MISWTSFSGPPSNKSLFFGFASGCFNFNSWRTSSNRSYTILCGLPERSCQALLIYSPIRWSEKKSCWSIFYLHCRCYYTVVVGVSWIHLTKPLHVHLSIIWTFSFLCVLLISFESFGGKFSKRKLSKNITLIIAMFFEGLPNEQASTILFISPTEFLSALFDKVRNLSFTENHLFISFIYFFRILLPMLRCLCLNFVHGCYCLLLLLLLMMRAIFWFCALFDKVLILIQISNIFNIYHI